MKFLQIRGLYACEAEVSQGGRKRASFAEPCGLQGVHPCRSFAVAAVFASVDVSGDAGTMP